MSLRRYAIFDGSTLHSSLELDAGGVDLLTLSAGLNTSRNARSTVSQTLGTHFVQIIPYGQGALSGKLRFGVGLEALANDTEPGTDPNCVAWRSEGDIYHDNTNIASASSASTGSVLSLFLSLNDDGTGTVAWYSGTTLLADIALPTELEGAPLFFFVGLGSTSEAADIRVRLCTGRERFEYWPAPAEGWFSVPPIGGALRIGSMPYLSGPTEDPPFTRWEQGITEDDVVIDRALSFWPWRTGQGGARGGAITITFTDPKGILNPALNGTYRDLPATLTWLEDGEDLATATGLGAWSIERVVPVDAHRRRVELRDALARLERPLQRRLIRPDASPEAANRPWPTTIGACFSVEPVLLDQDDYTYAIDSFGASQVGKVRDKGDPLSIALSDYTINDGGQTITLASPPQGIVTVDASVTGTGYVPPVQIDALNGIGAPFTGTNGSAPDDWVSSNTSHAYYQDGTARFENIYASKPWLRATDGVDPILLTAGQAYLVTFVVDVLPQNPDLTAMSRYLSLCRTNSVFNEFFQVREPGVYQFYYVPPTSHQVNIIHSGTTAGGPPARVSLLEFIEIPGLDDSEPDDEVEEALEPLTLKAMLTELIQHRGELPAGIWDPSTAETLDTSTGFRGLGYHTREQSSVREAVDSLLDGYTASIAPARDGVLKVHQLLLPELETATAELNTDDFLEDPLPSWDEAPGLTRTLGCRPNERVLTDSDLVTDEVEVTFALRRKLARLFRFICTSGAPLAPQYAHADANDPLATRLVKRADGQAAIDYACNLYTRSRGFWRVRSRWRDDIDLGDIVTLRSPIYPETENGRKLQVVGVRESPLSREITFTLWGLALGEL